MPNTVYRSFAFSVMGRAVAPPPAGGGASTAQTGSCVPSHHFPFETGFHHTEFTHLPTPKLSSRPLHTYTSQQFLDEVPYAGMRCQRITCHNMELTAEQCV